MRDRGSLLRAAVLGAFWMFWLASPASAAGVHRLGADASWQYCTLAGERRPAAPCAQVRLLASARDANIPDDGVVEATLTGGDGGPTLLVSESLIFNALPEAPDVLVRWQKLGATLTTVTGLRGLQQALGNYPMFRPAPGSVQAVSAPPPTLAFRFAPEERGHHAAYAVWGWPIARAQRVVGPFTPAAGQRLRLTFGVQDAAWDGGGPPVRFRADLKRPRGRSSLWRRTLDPARVETDRGWQEVDLDLEASGEPVELVLAARAEGGASLPVWGRPALVDRNEESSRPNIILLSLDTLRADHVGAYGHSRPTTPALDALASRAVLFEQVIAPFPSTTASHMTMLTSLEPCAHGVLSPSFRLSPSIPIVTESLAAAGYATAGITEDGFIKGAIGFERGFDTYRDLLPDPVAAPLGLFSRGIALSLAWLERHADRPFFLFLHTYQIHPPYKVPEKYQSLFPVAADAPEAERLDAEYDRGLRHADDLVAGLLDALHERGLDANTVLLVTADHGIEFGEHGGIGHARGVYEEQVRVPLIVQGPRVARGRRVRGQVGLIDLAPTILGLAGLSAPAHFVGTSLLPFLTDGTEPPERELVAEQLLGPRQTLVRTSARALIQKASGLELYDLSADPGEQKNLAPEMTSLAAEGAKRIADFRAACRHRQASLRAGPGHVPLDPELTKSLRALGYIK